MKHEAKLRLLAVSLVFLSIGFFDLFYFLSLNIFMFFPAENPLLTRYFWSAARLTEGIGLIVILLVHSHKHVTKNLKNKALIACIFMIFTVLSLIASKKSYFFYTIPPIINIKSVDVTITVLHISCLIIIAFTYSKVKKSSIINIGLGVSLITMSEFGIYYTFLLYEYNSFFNLILKTLGQFFLFKGVFFPEVDKIFNEKAYLQSKLHQTEQKLKIEKNNLALEIMSAQEEERKKVARDLHDGIGQSIYSILIYLRRLQSSKSDKNLKVLLKRLETMTSTTLNEVKDIAQDLRPSVLDHFGFITAIRSHIDQYERIHCIPVELNVTGEEKRLLPEIETALFRIFQETLSNTAKHANATHIKVNLFIEYNYINLFIMDNGIGFNIQSISRENNQGLGLFSIRERAKLVNGEATITSKEGIGTITEIIIPTKADL